MAESPTVLEEFTAKLVSLGESEVRAKLLQRVWNSPRKEWAIEWLESEEKKISAAAALRAEAREEEILSVAKEANEIARAASFAATAAAAAASEANKIARSARIISLTAAIATAVAAIAAIVAIKW